ncbi:MAG TPA: hypothetical protein VJT33_01210 [bacterium]|nr:hypothetical protein [bacterium]
MTQPIATTRAGTRPAGATDTLEALRRMRYAVEGSEEIRVRGACSVERLVAIG